MGLLREVDPGNLIVPPSREDGPVPSRYQNQVRRFGADISSMPPISVTECKYGDLMITNGVTRAVRAYYLAQSQVIVEVIDVRHHADVSKFKRVCDLTPPTVRGQSHA